MSLRKPLIIATGLALVASLFVVAPASAHSHDAGVARKTCKATVVSISGLAGVQMRTLVAKPGKNVVYRWKVTKGCGGTIVAKLGNAVVAKAAVKNREAKLTIPRSKIKAGVKNKVTLTYGKSKPSKATLWLPKGSMTTKPAKSIAYWNNDVEVTTTITWTGPMFSPTLFLDKRSATATPACHVACSVVSGMKIGVKKAVSTWLHTGNLTPLSTMGTHNIRVAFTWTSAPIKASLTNEITVEVRSNVFQGATIPAAGQYRWPSGNRGVCFVMVEGPDRPYGFETYSGTATANVPIKATDTRIEFSQCGGGPVPR